MTSPSPATADTDLPAGCTLAADLHEGEEDAEQWGDLPRRYVSVLHHEDGAVAQLDYVFNPARARVTLAGDLWVDEAHRRQGLATAMVAHLRALHPGAEIDPNGFTDDGMAFWASLG